MPLDDNGLIALPRPGALFKGLGESLASIILRQEPGIAPGRRRIDREGLLGRKPV